MAERKKRVPSLPAVAVVVVLALVASRYPTVRTVLEGLAGDGAPAVTPAAGGEAELLRAFEEGRSGVQVRVAGTVDRTLPDDLEGSRHQRFVLRLAGGHTVLVAHNIDLAPRAPLAPGDAVELAGQYEWNDEGGVVHWTHHDPVGRHPGGWIRHDGRTFE